MQPAIEALQERIRAAAAGGQKLCIQGHGSKAFYGEAPQGELLSLSEFVGISSYGPSELVVTVKAGWNGKPDEREFLREVFASACATFNTTLGPGAPHATSRCAQVRSPLGRQPGRGGAGVSKGVGGPGNQT